MGFRSDVSREAKWRERRRGVRLNSTVVVAVDWTDESGAAHHAEAKTRIVNPNGCMVVLPFDLPVGQKVRVTNLGNNGSCDAEIVWKGNHRVEGWELGIELIKPEMDFWGLDL